MRKTKRSSNTKQETPINTDRRRKTRSRPVPRWLMSSNELDAIAQRRCLLVLSVLSGELPVTEAISQMQISRGMYYQLETRALNAMVRVLTPGAPDDESATGSLTGQIAILEEKLKRMEQEKRRADRLLLLTKKMLSSGPVKTSSGRPPGSRNRPKTSSTRTTTATTSLKTTPPQRASSVPSPDSNTEGGPPSIPTRDGATES
jgi:hypothetical protein